MNTSRLNPNKKKNELMFQVIAAILNMGNIEFEGTTESRIMNIEQVEIVCDLLQVDLEQMKQALVIFSENFKFIILDGSYVTKWWS